MPWRARGVGAVHDRSGLSLEFGFRAGIVNKAKALHQCLGPGRLTLGLHSAVFQESTSGFGLLGFVAQGFSVKTIELQGLELQDLWDQFGIFGVFQVSAQVTSEKRRFPKKRGFLSQVHA